MCGTREGRGVPNSERRLGDSHGTLILEVRQHAALTNLRHLLFRLDSSRRQQLHISLLLMTGQKGFFITVLNNILTFIFQLYLDNVKREQQAPVIGLSSSY